MQNALTVYFDGEKSAGLLLAAAAAGVLVAAIVMYRAGAGFRPFAATIGLLALAQIALGVGLYLRTGPQVSRLEQQLQSDAGTFYTAEGARMARVQRTFVIIEYVELFIIIAAAGTAVFLRGRPGVGGIALGLVVSASMLLAFDVFAERRGAEYLTTLTADRPTR